MARAVRAFLDASVLYPVTLRNLLMRLTLAGLYQARWSAHVHEEWIRSVARNHPNIPLARLLDVRAVMDENAEDSLVTGYEALIETLTLPDPNDRHVLAAAITAGADVIVTHNLRDFPPAALDPFEIETQHPDAFIHRLVELAPEIVIEAVRSQQASLTKPPVSMSDLLALLERLGLSATVGDIRRLMPMPR